MAASSDSDEDETFVSLGTSLDIPEKDEPRRKRVSFQDIQVKDSKGRARFHGAFTGGFSAGYFNTAGSQTGFTPSTFVSSREKRADTRDLRKPEDFMDDEDLGEHGIAPRKLVTAGAFSSEERKRRRHDELTAASSNSIIPGEATLLDLIVPERITIGVKLLRKMGWKEGQGLGPRLSQKQKKRQKAGMKVYGCEMPPSPGSDEDIDDDTFLSNLTYAPRDTTQIYLSVKDNTHGLGYRGLDPRSALPSAHLQLFEPPAITKPGMAGRKGRKGIRGQAFGVGALEEEDDDIYAVDSMSNYDMTMGGDEKDANFGWTAPRKQGAAQTPVGYVGTMLEGFSLSSSKLVQTKLFPPPQLPRGYRPVHVFATLVKTEPVQEGRDFRQFLRPDTDPAPVPDPPPSSSSGRPTQCRDAASRSLALGEKAFVGSVFDLIPKEDKERMEASKTITQQDQQQQRHSSDDDVQVRPEETPRQASTGDQPDPPPPPTSDPHSAVDELRRENVPLYQGGLGFKPFIKDPAKQERYDRYLALVKQGHKAPYLAVMEEGQTEWGAEREQEEFNKAAHLFKPLAGMMAMRFTTGSQHDDPAGATGNQLDKVEKSEAAKAAEMKMYGQLTREVHEWHPDRLLCKRFNVPDPYPGSNIVGLASVKRDKYSVFNFLDFANSSSFTAPPTEGSPAQSQEQSTPNANSSAQSQEKTSGNWKETETESKFDKELNKSKKMKSIFSHLMGPGGGADKNSGVSFTVKSAKPKQQKEFKSIFSHLDGDDENRSRKTVAMETDSAVTDTNVPGTTAKKAEGGVQDPGDKKLKENSEGAKTEMDLFRAIFRNTDSEDSSSSDSEEEESVAGGSGTVTNSRMAAESVTHTANIDTPERDKTSNSDPMIATLPGSGDRMVTVENKLPPDDAMEDSESYGPAPPTLPGSQDRLESIQERLSPGRESEDSESYGPALPPAYNTGEPVAQASSVVIDLTATSSSKHRHRDRHKAKKDKKEKHKKSKHKKKHKKKESKKKKKRRVSSDSSDTSDKESDDDLGDVPSDKELLNRLKMLKPGRHPDDFF